MVGFAGDGLRSDRAVGLRPHPRDRWPMLPAVRHLRAGALGHFPRPALCYQAIGRTKFRARPRSYGARGSLCLAVCILILSRCLLLHLRRGGQRAHSDRPQAPYSRTSWKGCSLKFVYEVSHRPGPDPMRYASPGPREAYLPHNPPRWGLPLEGAPPTRARTRWHAASTCSDGCVPPAA